MTLDQTVHVMYTTDHGILRHQSRDITSLKQSLPPNIPVSCLARRSRWDNAGPLASTTTQTHLSKSC